MTKEEGQPRVRIVSPAESVPVYNCVVYVRRVESSVEAHIANLAGVSISGDSEREVLQKAVCEFKRIIAEYHARNVPVPILSPPPPQENETVRYIAVHL